jgi:hypothetical protein
MLLMAAVLNWYTSWLLVQMSRATGAESYEVCPPSVIFPFLGPVFQLKGGTSGTCWAGPRDTNEDNLSMVQYMSIVWKVVPTMFYF